MSIRDYNMTYVITNQRNDVIKVPKQEPKYETEALKMYNINQIMLFEMILTELKDSESITISKSYITD